MNGDGLLFLAVALALVAAAESLASRGMTDPVPFTLDPTGNARDAPVNDFNDGIFSEPMSVPP